MATEPDTQLVEMRVVDVRRRPASAELPAGYPTVLYAIVLEEVGGPRRLPIYIGRFEGESMALQLEKVQLVRPLTYNFVASLLQASGARLTEVRISKLSGDTFYAVAILDGPNGTASVDARPSDALNLALVAGAPIRVEPAVLEVLQVDRPDRQEAVQRLWGDDTKGAAEILAEMGSGPGSDCSQRTWR